MATMTVRTRVAFDPATAARLERLAKRWGISKSETLRRALEAAEIAATTPSAGSSQPTLEEITVMTHQDALDWSGASHGLGDRRSPLPDASRPARKSPKRRTPIRRSP